MSAVRLGHRSAILLPLRVGETSSGVLGIFASMPGAFEAQESSLLTDLVEDFSSCIHGLRERAAAARLSLRLREEAEREIRSRLAAALHDGVSQTLLALNVELAQARSMLRRGAPLDSGTLDRLVVGSRNALDQLRDVNVELRPAPLTLHSFTAAVFDQCNESAELAGLPVIFHADETPLVLAESVKLQCFLAFREALCNAVHHAHASRIDVYLRARPKGCLTLAIVDDGIGLAPRSSSERRSGMGLSILRERIDAVRGRVDLRSRHGRGTLVRIRIPLAPTAMP
ncbi:integral membrane sensor signal transduction histidine kinase [Imhoffiella purpurea]|uniref:Oxygen sensor histidine kinase NreB n=1 Tax=Imhoffiella purpurea TaxID=1249627 RepID=W9VC29_9GAMM|nr:integral membrane sensor signal transduction histidine kinase [Imhoffiella purpurea]